MRFHVTAPILTHRQIGETEFELIVHAPGIAREARPGQFLQVLYGGAAGPFMRRPFSVFYTDPAAGAVSIVYLARGSFTHGLRSLGASDSISIVGPIGNAFVPDRAPNTRHLLVAGGVGAPPLYFMAKQMLAEHHDRSSIVVINGARSRDLLVAMPEFNALGIAVQATTDDGSQGRHGTAADELSDQIERFGADCAVYACGPTPMLQAVGDLSIASGIRCKISVETVMPCGLGVCMGCVIKLRSATAPSGYTYVRSCHDGPIFDASEVIW